MKTKLIAVLLTLGTALFADAAQITASLLYKVNLGDKGVPADAVIDADSTGIYDAFTGSYTVYRDGRAVKTVQRDFLKGGNCLVENGNYFLFCNSNNNTLDMLTGSLERYSSYGLPEGFKGEYDPTDAMSSGGFIYSVDNDSHRVLKTDIITKKTVLSAGKYGQDKLEFWYPYSIAVDKKGVLYVSEVFNTRVQKITKDLKFYEFIGSWGISPGEFYRPTGIAVYKGVNLFVADGYTGVVQYFDGDGRFAGILKDSSGKKLQFGSVTHIRISGNTLAVVDAYNKSVYVYGLKEK